MLFRSEGGVRAIDPATLQDADFLQRPGVVVEALWKLQLGLHSRLPEVDRDCASEMRNTFRLIRFLKDYLGERERAVVAVDPSKVDFKKIPIPMRDSAPHYQVLTASPQKGFEFRPGDLMIVTDHLNLMGDNPLKGPNLAQLGPRFPDLSEAYSRACVDILLEEGRAAGKIGRAHV